MNTIDLSKATLAQAKKLVTTHVYYRNLITQGLHVSVIKREILTIFSLTHKQIMFIFA